MLECPGKPISERVVIGRRGTTDARIVVTSVLGTLNSVR